MGTVCSTGEECTNEANMFDAGSQCGVWEKRLVVEGLLEPEECLGFVLNSASRLALPKNLSTCFFNPRDTDSVLG